MDATRNEQISPKTTCKVRTLADGREIMYYDFHSDSSHDSQDRVANDKRDLTDAPTHTELRRDPLLDEWVVVAGHRQARTFHPPTNECPLCPSTTDQFTEIPESDYEVVVFENRFPSLTTHEIKDSDVPDTFPGFGRCEVVCFTSDHNSSLANVSPARMRTILSAWMDRNRALSEIKGVEYVFIFENRGVEVGVTLSHPHGQIYAYPFIPPREKQMRAVATKYRNETGRSLYEDVIDSEIVAQDRIVFNGEHWIGFVPRAARWPFEIQLFTRRSLSHLSELNEAEQEEFAHAYLTLLKSLDAVLDVEMPYIAAWHQAPVGFTDQASRLFLEVFTLRRAQGKLKYLAGSESAAWVWINDIAPEHAASEIRAAAKRITS